MAIKTSRVAFSYADFTSFFVTQISQIMTDNELTVPITYKDTVLKSPLRLDIIVNQQVIIELKSVEEMKPVYGKQLLTYLKLMKKHTGLLVNFSENNIREGIQRIVN